MDGRLLALAREEKDNIRNRALQEDDRRHRLAYSRVPELRSIDGRMGPPSAAAARRRISGRRASTCWQGARSF